MNFERILRLPQMELKQALSKEVIGMGYEKTISQDGFLYVEGTVPVLMVAHMDRIHTYDIDSLCRSSDGVFMSPQGIGGDDRCGVYALLQVAKTYKVHLLFTEDEEIGCVGAKKFVKAGIIPEVNYIIEVDRKGVDDAVFYQCDNKDFTKFIVNHGFVEELGSCSDISDIAPHLGVAAVNLSSGYYNPHMISEYIVLEDLRKTIGRILTILADDVSTKYTYVKKEYKSSGCVSYYHGYRDDYYDYDNCYGWTKNKETGKWEEVRKVSTIPPVTTTENKIYWLFKGDYFIRAKSGDTSVLLPCDGYGVTKHGKIVHRAKYSGVTVGVGDKEIVSIRGVVLLPEWVWKNERSLYNICQSVEKEK